MKFYYLIFVLVLGASLVGCHWGLYSATAQIQIRPRFVTDVASLSPDGSPTASMSSEWSAAQIKIMQNADVLEPVLSKLNLEQIWAKRFNSGQASLSDQDALNHLLKVLHFESTPGTNIFKITAQSEIPQEAADVANAIADQYKAMDDAEEARRTQRGLDSLRGEIARQQSVLENAKHVVDVAKNDAQRETGHSVATEAQSLLNALNVRLQQVTTDSRLTESPVRIIARAVAPPE